MQLRAMCRASRAGHHDLRAVAGYYLKTAEVTHASAALTASADPLVRALSAALAGGCRAAGGAAFAGVLGATQG